MCKLIFQTKIDALDEIIRYKAWLVAKGYSQVDEVDFHKTLAPMAKFIIIRCIFTTRVTMDWEIHQMDLHTMSLNGVLKVGICMDQLEEFVQKG